MEFTTSNVANTRENRLSFIVHFQWSRLYGIVIQVWSGSMLHFGSVGQQHHTVRGSMKHLLKHVWTSRVQIGDRNARIYRENHFRNPVTPPKRQRDKPSPTTTFAILDTLQRNSKLPPSGARSGIFHKHSQAWGPHPLIPKAFLPTEVKGCSPPINSMASCSFSHVIYLYNLSIYIYISDLEVRIPNFWCCPRSGFDRYPSGM